MYNTQNHTIEVSQLKVGLFIHLDLGWMDHPFPSSNFKIKSEDDIIKIKKANIKQVRYDPNRSDCEPVERAQAPTEQVKVVPTYESTATAKTEVEKNLKLERLKTLHKAIDESEKKFLAARGTALEATRDILNKPDHCITEATNMVNDMVDSVLSESDIVIHAINGNRSSDQNYLHCLNVTVLSMIMGKAIDISEKDMRTLGLAALFHDIGKLEIPDRILMKKEPLNLSEQSFFELHCEIGARMAKNVGLPDSIAEVILNHHECFDGTGYPAGKKTSDIAPLARIVALVNSFDNLCNPSNPMLAKTPYEALVHMFTQHRNKYDQSLLKRLIKFLGVYPPGSVVQLSNGVHGIVISVNPNTPLRPFVLLHDPTSKREEPLIVDLREDANLNISICLRPSQLPQEELEYLNPRKRISYFIDQEMLPA